MLAKIRLSWKWLAVTSTLAAELLTTVKSFIVTDNGVIKVKETKKAVDSSVCKFKFFRKLKK